MKCSAKIGIAGVLAIIICGCTAPPQPLIRPFGDDHDAMLVQPMEYQIGTSAYRIVVPPGFVTDYTSSPTGTHWLVPVHGRYTRGAIIHDYLYWTQLCSRKQADTILLIAMKESGVSKDQLFEIYYGLRLGGGGAWTSNHVERESGLIRTIPSAYRDIAPNVDWGDYRIQLRAKGIRELPYVDSGTYCVAGNSKDIPEAVRDIATAVDAKVSPTD